MRMAALDVKGPVRLKSGNLIFNMGGRDRIDLQSSSIFKSRLNLQNGFLDSLAIE